MNENVVLRAYVTNLGLYNEGMLVGEWVDFPTTHEKMKEVMRRIRIDGKEYEEYFITDYESDIDGLTECFGEYENLSMLNYLAGKIQDMDYSVEQLEAMIEYGEFTGSVEELINLIDNEECFMLMPDVESDYDLGYEYAENSGLFTEALKSLGMLANYIDYEGYGRDIRLEEGGMFTEHGYMVMTDDMDTYFDSSADEIPEEFCL